MHKIKIVLQQISLQIMAESAGGVAVTVPVKNRQSIVGQLPSVC